MKEIALTQGKFAIVDDDDFEWLNQWKWCYNQGYAVRGIGSIINGDKTILMHAAIMQTPKGWETDHINMNRLDNRRENLRICTRSENSMNKKRYLSNTTGYKGVWYSKKDKRFVAEITINKKKICLGYFRDVEDAGNAYKNAVSKYHGKFARVD